MVLGSLVYYQASRQHKAERWNLIFCSDTVALTAGAGMQGAAIKLYKGLACPLDGFELVLCSLSGPDGQTYPMCPFCYNNPPFEGIQKVGVTLCTHMQVLLTR